MNNNTKITSKQPKVAKKTQRSMKIKSNVKAGATKGRIPECD